MNTLIRKDSKVSAHTINNVVILGTVKSVAGTQMLVETPAGVSHTVLKVSATKLSAAEFKVLVTEASQPKVEAKPEVTVEAPVDVKKEIKKQVKKEVAKEVAKVNKKALALEIFNKHKGAKRKVVIAEFKENGMSAACASTYYQNIKSGAWA